jgi:hypothetical protein
MATGDFTVLQPRQKKYIEFRVQGMSRTEAKRAAQYAETTAPGRIENSSVKAAFAQLIRRAAPAHKLAKVISDGLEATETKFFQHEGRVTDSKELINWSERRAYAELAAEYGGYAESKGKGTDVNVAVGFTLINCLTKPKHE